MQSTLQGLIDEMNRMSAEHDRGDIDVNIDAARFQGAFKAMGEGVNNMVNGHIAVKKKAMACIQQFGEGNLDARYAHVNAEGGLMTGECRTTPERLPDGRLRLHEEWRWTSGDGSSGRSVVEEIGE